MYKLFRKARSLFLNVALSISTLSQYCLAAINPFMKIGRYCTFGKNSSLSTTDGGSIVIGEDVHISEGVKITAQGGTIKIENRVFIGLGCIIACKNSVTISKDALIAEYVVIRDQDHETTQRPIRSAGFLTAPIHIGQDVWIGSKATILRGVSIGNGAVVGAHALVNNDVQPSTLVVGVPAHSVKKLSDTA